MSISQETGDFAVQIICSPHPTEKKVWIDKILTQHITFPNDKIRMDAMFLKNSGLMNKETYFLTQDKLIFV